MSDVCPITGYAFLVTHGDHKIYKDKHGRGSHGISNTLLALELDNPPPHVIDYYYGRLYDAWEEMTGNCIPMITTNEIVPQPWAK